MSSLLNSADIYDMRREDPGIRISGFCDPEYMGRWSSKDEAEVTIPFTNNAGPFIAIIIEYFAHVVKDIHPTQRVEISIDGHPHDRWVLRDEWYRKRAIVVDRDKLSDKSKITINFKFPDRVKPSVFGIFDDDRTLAIMIRRFYILNLHYCPSNSSPLSQIGMRYVGTESRKTWDDKHLNGFWSEFIDGPNVLDIGFASYGDPNVVPIVEGAVGVDIDFPGYDGRTLPFEDGSQDSVYSSHCLEHIPDAMNAIQEWHRVVKESGHIIIAVPNRSLYERRRRTPSRWNAEHLRMYSPASLLSEIESALEPNSYRIRHLSENDDEYDYSLPLDRHPSGNYEIVAVIQKISKPKWSLED